MDRSSAKPTQASIITWRPASTLSGSHLVDVDAAPLNLLGPTESPESPGGPRDIGARRDRTVR